MKTCATCRHHNVTKCERIVTLAIGFEDDAEVCNDDGDTKQKAWLRTALNFGCVLHEEKGG